MAIGDMNDIVGQVGLHVSQPVSRADVLFTENFLTQAGKVSSEIYELIHDVVESGAVNSDEYPEGFTGRRGKENF